MDFSKFDLSAKCESVECHIIVLQDRPTLAKYIIPIISESELIYSLYQTYVNIFGVMSAFKHNLDFIFYSWQKVIIKFGDLFCTCQFVFFFYDGGSHHYKSQYRFFVFPSFIKELQMILQFGSEFPSALYYRSDICNYVASINKKVSI